MSTTYKRLAQNTVSLKMLRVFDNKNRQKKVCKSIQTFCYIFATQQNNALSYASE